MNSWLIRIFCCFFLGEAVFFPLKTFAQDTCSRVALVNHQEILVDTSSTKKGEGLRYYLQNDHVAKEYLDLYQEHGRPQWYNLAMGTVGTGFLIMGLSKAGSFSNTEGRFQSKAFLLMGGASLLLVNYLVAKTNEYNNERLLLRAIEEYNKRNLPTIYFSPISEEQEEGDLRKNFGFSTGFYQDF